MRSSTRSSTPLDSLPSVVETYALCSVGRWLIDLLASPEAMGRRKEAASSSDRETRRLNEHLADYTLCMKEIAEDGNCLFRSVADQLFGDTARADEVRERAVVYMREHKE